jgi:hypothetical protein
VPLHLLQRSWLTWPLRASEGVSECLQSLHAYQVTVMKIVDTTTNSRITIASIARSSSQLTDRIQIWLRVDRLSVRNHTLFMTDNLSVTSNGVSGLELDSSPKGASNDMHQGAGGIPPFNSRRNTSQHSLWRIFEYRDRVSSPETTYTRVPKNLECTCVLS